MIPSGAARRTRLQHSLVLLVPAVLFGLLVSVQWRTQTFRSELSVRYNAPLIDPANALLGAFDDPQQLSDIKQRRDVQGLGFRVTRATQIHVPGYTGALNIRYAEPRLLPTATR